MSTTSKEATYNKLASIIGDYYSEKKADDPYQAPFFNPIEPLMGRKERDNFENQLSSCVKYFLDPLEQHNQGRLFLNSFLEQLNLKNTELLYRTTPLVTLEKSINKRRIDIDISWPENSFSIGIELKVWANDGNRQIQNYLDYYQKEKHDFFLLYLSFYKKKPSHHSTFTWDEFENKGKAEAQGITDWLIEMICKWHEVAKAPEVKEFLHNFGAFLKQRCLKDTRSLNFRLQDTIYEHQEEVEKIIFDDNLAFGTTVEIPNYVKEIKGAYQFLLDWNRNRSADIRKSFLKLASDEIKISAPRRNHNRGNFEIQVIPKNVKIIKRLDCLNHVIEVHGLAELPESDWKKTKTGTYSLTLKANTSPRKIRETMEQLLTYTQKPMGQQ